MSSWVAKTVNGLAILEMTVDATDESAVISVVQPHGMDGASLVITRCTRWEGLDSRYAAIAVAFDKVRERALTTLSVRRHGRDVMAGFAKCLTATGVMLYTEPSRISGHQGDLSNPDGQYLNVVLCEERNLLGLYRCGNGAVFRHLPVWEVRGERLEGVQSVSDLIDFSGCPWPPAEEPRTN